MPKLKYLHAVRAERERGGVGVRIRIRVCACEYVYVSLGMSFPNNANKHKKTLHMQMSARNLLNMCLCTLDDGPTQIRSAPNDIIIGMMSRFTPEFIANCLFASDRRARTHTDTRSHNRS